MIRTSLPVKKALKPRRCRSCGNPYVPISSMAKACSVPCALDLVRQANARKEARAKREERAATRVAKEKLKSRADYLREAQTAVNAYVRLRDANEPCISCDRPATWGGQWHASHYRSVGSNPGWRFNVLNIHRACSICNAWKSGNLTEYRPRLITKIGLERVELLEQESPVRKYDIEYLKRLKKVMNKKARRLERRIEQRKEAA
ncbi:recombination protein NinG [Paraburkholderia phenoliruptrix]|uniref:recombination protein NinG n=1 Tax=Paraburkholderia phenoliruptrix TaxID=252970 RepID=UPI002865BF86|nr:recombination protein NinG [Paraburkholderia phenoliruptrix]MDR6389202.1 nitrogen fixation protein [Paraburkholderia phenoliruptrix]